MARTTEKNREKTIITSDLDIYIDSALGIDSETQSGSASQPFASTEFALELIMRKYKFRTLETGPSNAIELIINYVGAHNDPGGFINLSELEGYNFNLVFKTGTGPITYSSDLNISNCNAAEIISFTSGFGALDSNFGTVAGNVEFSNCRSSITVSDITFENLVKFFSCRISNASDFPAFGFDTIFKTSVTFENINKARFQSSFEDNGRAIFINCHDILIQGDVTLKQQTGGGFGAIFRFENCSGLVFDDDDLIFETNTLLRPLVQFYDCYGMLFQPDFIRNTSGGNVALNLSAGAYFIDVSRSMNVDIGSSIVGGTFIDPAAGNRAFRIDDTSSVLDIASGGGTWNALDLGFIVAQVDDIAPGAYVNGYKRYPSYVDDTAAGVGGLTTGQPYINTTIGALAIKI